MGRVQLMTNSGVFYKKQGQGEPLVLIHGLFGSNENLGSLARLFAEHFTVYSIDLPNHGRSSHSESTDLNQMVNEVCEWLDLIGVDSTHILGHSLGGKVAMEIALGHPQRVKRLIVMDIAPVHYESQHNDVFDGLLAIDVDNIDSRADAEKTLKSYVEETAIRSFLLKNLARETGGGFSWRMNLSAIHQGYSQLIKENTNDTVFDGETLFIKGGNSDYIKEEYRDEIVKRFPKTNLKVVANTGHWLHAEKPDIVAKLAIKFLS